ncbi:fasciclin domain-containing protein [Mesonia ostreae]|uniref:Fasciclin domain-containing protein n=1 Tax=Mesonia ostreae TaxID=861110 RepID=A0ABU2KGS7_9FLAO|nr:fasciclin domain-containing protein [Mesonia ostreae]MDT0293901.1 fasciclin domain-containing protein [Mesonia ostreae]
MNYSISKLTKILPVLLFACVLFSCQDDDDNGNVIEGNNSIINYLQKNDQYSNIAAAIVKAGYEGTLDGNSGVYTFFAPDNGAMNLYFTTQGISGVEALSQEEAQQLVNYHLLLTPNNEENFITGYIKTNAKKVLNDSVSYNLDLFVDTEQDLIFNAQTQISFPDIEVDNGVLHGIDRVLNPPSVSDFMQIDNRLQAYYDELTTENLLTEIDSEENKTIFAPLGVEFESFLNNQSLTPSEKENFLKNHLMDGFLTTDFLKTGYLKNKATAFNNEAIDTYFNLNLGLLLNGSSSIVQQDVIATNGVIHILDGVLEVPTLATFINADADLVKFQIALTRDDQLPEDYINRLMSTNGGEDPFTVFGPINTAFDSALLELFPEQNATLEDIDTATLTSILNNHIETNNAFTLDNLPSNVNTLEGQLQVTKTDSTFTLTDAQLRTSNSVRVDIQAKNGLLHKIDTLLLP